VARLVESPLAPHALRALQLLLANGAALQHPKGAHARCENALQTAHMTI
jgi:hypothetical protein